MRPFHREGRIGGISYGQTQKVAEPIDCLLSIYCGENIKMMEEGVDVEAFYVCVKFTLICESRSTVCDGFSEI